LFSFEKFRLAFQIYNPAIVFQYMHLNISQKQQQKLAVPTALYVIVRVQRWTEVQR
jgi:hypothetical protein